MIDTPVTPPKHPAPFSKTIITTLTPLLADLNPAGALVLDPFAGTGQIAASLAHLRLTFVLSELEWEWIEQAPPFALRLQANALHLPYRDSSFDAAVTSVVYGNRMSDHHNAKDKCKKCDGTGFTFVQTTCKSCQGRGLSHRFTYRHYLGRELHEQNAGRMQWGEKYRALHLAAYPELIRVLKPDALFFLNISDHERAGIRQLVVRWHSTTLTSLGLKMERLIPVCTRRMKKGANRDARVGKEMILVFRKVVVA